MMYAYDTHVTRYMKVECVKGETEDDDDDDE